MWYLQIRPLLILAAAAVLMAAFVKLFAGHARFRTIYKYVLMAASLAGIFIINYAAGLFYCVYTLFTYALVQILKRSGRGCKPLFALFVVLCFIPLIAVRLINIRSGEDFSWLTIGIAFNMLKAADALFYTYYTGERIRFTVFINFIIFLPTFTAGPIIRFRDFVNTEILPVASTDVVYCAKRIIRGMFKKIVIVTFIMLVFNRLLEVDSSILVSLAVIVSSYFLLFFDLSGYSDIAIAFGRLFGVKVAENFKNPFRAPSLTIFWRNWHVTLSDWIREHVFVVFSEKKLNKLPAAALSFAVMVFMGLWHGFSLPILIGGAYNGAFLFIESLCGWTGYKRNSNKALFVIRCVLTNFVFAVNTLLFTTDIAQMTGILKGLAIWK